MPELSNVIRSGMRGTARTPLKRMSFNLLRPLFSTVRVKACPSPQVAVMLRSTLFGQGSTVRVTASFDVCRVESITNKLIIIEHTLPKR
jgi:hypothetical protein